MSTTVHDTTCRSCSAPADLGSTKCRYCGQPVLISTFNSVHNMPMPMVNQYAASYREALANEPDAKDLNGTLGMCYLKLKMYDKATAAFDKAIEDNFDKPDMFFYAAICRLAGRKAFSVPRADIDKIEEYMNAALMIEPKGIFHFFLAYVKYDFYSRKFINTTPGYEEKLSDAKAAGLSPVDVNDLFGILGVDLPSQLTV